MRLIGRGIARLNGHGKGDHYINIKIHLPKYEIILFVVNYCWFKYSSALQVFDQPWIYEIRELSTTKNLRSGNCQKKILNLTIFLGMSHELKSVT